MYRNTRYTKHDVFVYRVPNFGTYSSTVCTHVVKLTKTLKIIRKDDILVKIFFFIFNAYFKTFLHILVDFCAYLCAYLTQNS